MDNQETTTQTPNVVNMSADVQIRAGAMLGSGLMDNNMRQCDIHDVLAIWASVESSLAQMPERIRDDVRDSLMVKYCTAADYDLWAGIDITDVEADASEAIDPDFEGWQ